MSKGKEIATGDALDLVQQLLDVLGPKAKVAGSMRRGREYVRDVDVVVPGPIDMKRVRKVVQCVVEAGEKKVRVKVRKGLQVDIVVTDTEHEGAALLYLTGPREFNLAMRSMAKSAGLKLNEKGLWKVRGRRETLVAASSEREIFKALGLKFVFPTGRNAGSLHPLSDEGLDFEIPGSKPGTSYTVVFRDGKPHCPCRGFVFSSTKSDRVPRGYTKWCRHCTAAMILFNEAAAA